ncbi:hypothetical protein Golax_005411 [Gossypium laxum]|uniref:Uncharacterized protein n=1 Tax=Gossypium laxum TaxID=34288 RepID=A0A7J9A112_9ROSI|nr:hypothetical protein [Gossypium laxum]
MSGEKVNREAMYRVLKSLWFTKEEASFVALTDGVILVNFGNIDDRTRMLNLTPWLFDQSLFAFQPFIKGQELDGYVAIDVGKAIGEFVAIDWRDRDGGGLTLLELGKEEHLETNNLSFQYGSWLRVRLGGSTQTRGNWRNGIEILEKKINPSSVREAWVVGGYFNAIINDVEKEGARRKSRVDRLLISANAIGNFPFLVTIVVRQTNLDHDAILMDTLRHKPRENFKDPRLFFKYDVCWAKEKEAKDIIKKAWNSNDTNIIEKLEKVCVELGTWQHGHYRRMKNQIRELVARIDKLIDDARRENNVDMFKTARLKLRDLYSKEESFFSCLCHK